MERAKSTVLLLATLATGAAGCNSNGSTPTDAATTTMDLAMASATKDLASTDLATGPTAMVTALMVDYQSSMPIVGGQLCQSIPVPAAMNCATTGADGTATIALPIGVDAAITMAATGYFTGQRFLHLTDMSPVMSSLALFSVNTLNLLASFSGAQPDDTKGQVLFVAEDLSPMDGGSPSTDGGASDGGLAPSKRAGITISIAPKSGTGPIYVGEGGFPDKTATSTSSKGAAVIVNADPGSAELTYVPAKGVSCANVQGWAGSTAASQKLAVTAMTLDYLFVGCQ